MLIRELLTLDALSSFQLLSGESGADHPMKEMVLLEYERLPQDSPDHYKEALIVSTLHDAKDDPQALYAIVEQLIQLGAAGLAFRSTYFRELPEAVLELSNREDFPIFRFDNMYMEDVVLSIADYMRLRSEFSIYEEPLFRILQGTAEGYGIEFLCTQMNPNRQKYMNAAYIHSPDLTYDWATPLQHQLRLRQNQELLADCRFLQFRRGFFIIFNHTEEPPLAKIAESTSVLLEKLGCDLSRLCIGVGRLYRKSSDFDCVIREAFDALLYAIYQKQPSIVYPQMMLYQTILPLVRDKSTRQSMTLRFQTLREYDQESGNSVLMTTLKAYTDLNYDLRATAALLKQHPNTIRYRLKKICELTASPVESEHALFLMGEFMRMDSLSASIF